MRITLVAQMLTDQHMKKAALTVSSVFNISLHQDLRKKHDPDAVDRLNMQLHDILIMQNMLPANQLPVIDASAPHAGIF